MKIENLFVKYHLGVGLDFNTIYNILKTKNYYNNKEDFEIDLENAISKGLIMCVREKNTNKYYI